MNLRDLRDLSIKMIVEVSGNIHCWWHNQAHGAHADTCCLCWVPSLQLIDNGLSVGIEFKDFAKCVPPNISLARRHDHHGLNAYHD